MTAPERFRLTEPSANGVACDENGLVVGETPLLQQREDGAGWRPRSEAELNTDLSDAYSLPIEVAAKIGGIGVVARALNRGDVAYAQIATLNLRIPDPPSLAKRKSDADIADLVSQLKASDLLRKDWDPDKHPRWPAGADDGAGGQFAPSDGGTSAPSQTPTSGTNAGQEDRPSLIYVAKPDKEREDEEAAERDEAICRSLRDPAVRRRCWESANERRGARVRGKPLPALVTRKESAPLWTFPKLPIL